MEPRYIDGSQDRGWRGERSDHISLRIRINFLTGYEAPEPNRTSQFIPLTAPAGGARSLTGIATLITRKTVHSALRPHLVHKESVELISRSFALVLAVAVAALFVAQLSHSGQDRLPSALQESLNAEALIFLRNEYDILVTGSVPAEGLVPRLIGMARLEFSGQERIAALLKGREDSLQRGKRYERIEVILNPTGIEEHDSRVVLHAVDKVVEHFAFDPKPWPEVPNLYEESTRHDFIFSIAPISASAPRAPYAVRAGGFEYTLMKDVTEPQLLNASDEGEDDGYKYSRPPAISLENTGTVPKRQNRKKP